MPDSPAVSSAVGTRLLFENDRVRVLEYRDAPGDKTHQHHHPAFVLYALSEFERKIHLPDGRVLLDDVNFRIGEGARAALVGIEVDLREREPGQAPIALTVDLVPGGELIRPDRDASEVERAVEVYKEIIRAYFVNR